MGTELKLRTTQYSEATPFRVFSVPAAWASPGSLSKMQNLGLHPDPLHQQEEWVSSLGDSDTCFKAVFGRVAEVCAEKTPARALPQVVQGAWKKGAEASTF